MAVNFQQQNLTGRARRFALIIQLLFAKQGLAGKLVTAHRGARHLSLGIRLNDPTKLDPALKLAEPLALHSAAPAVLAQRAGGLIFYQFEIPQAFWEYYTRADLPTQEAIGLAEQRRPVIFTVEDAPHALVAGSTGSGKSEGVKSILMAQLTMHEPGNLALALIDPHGDYPDFHNVAHLIAPIAQDGEKIRHLLRFLVQELAYRKAENIRDGQPVLVVIDEANEVLSVPGNLALVQNLAQGRKYRIHLVIATQKPLHADLPKILDNLDNRFVGRVTDAKVSATVTGQAGLQAHRLTGKGDFLHVSGMTVERFQIAQATHRDFERLPRGETPQPVTVEDTPAIPILPEISGPGRPPVELDPRVLAHYFFHGPQNITHRLARELFGLARTGHTLHRDFCSEFAREYLRIRREQLQKPNLLG